MAFCKKEGQYLYIFKTRMIPQRSINQTHLEADYKIKCLNSYSYLYKLLIKLVPELVKKDLILIFGILCF